MSTPDAAVETELPPSIVEALIDAKAAKDKADAIYEAIRDSLIEEMEERAATHGLVGGRHLVTFINTTSTRLDSKRLKSEYPQIWRDYSVPSTYKAIRLVKSS